MLKRFAFFFTIFVIGLGFIFIGLDILDINEDYRLYLPIAVLNTIFIATVAFIVAYICLRKFISTGMPVILALGGAAMTFGVGILIYVWFTIAVLDVRVTVYDNAFFIAVVIHLSGAMIQKFKPNVTVLKSSRRWVTGSLAYLVIIFVILALTWLLYKNIIPSLTVPRNIAHWVSAFLCLIAAFIHFKIFLKNNNHISFWYSLGLAAFAMGIVFMAQGPLESRVAWLGRFGQYLGYFYFLITALGMYREKRTTETG